MPINAGDTLMYWDTRPSPDGAGSYNTVTL